MSVGPIVNSHQVIGEIRHMKMKFGIGLVIVGLALSSAMATRTSADTIVNDPGFQTNILARNDDGSTPLVALPFSANFFGLTFNSLYVNNNGNVTFDGPLSQFTPDDLTSTSKQIIAPFFADVDTRNLASGVTTYGVGSFGGHTAFGVDWFHNPDDNTDPGVGYYSVHADKLNSFQLLLVDRSDTGAGNFDIVFNYRQIQWETGDASGGTGGLGGSSARAGFSNGTGDPGSFFEINGSAVNGAFLDSNATTGLIHTSNIDVAGRWVFQARNGSVTPPSLPEPSSLAMCAIGGLGLIGAAWRRRRNVAN